MNKLLSRELLSKGCGQALLLASLIACILCPSPLWATEASLQTNTSPEIVTTARGFNFWYKHTPNSPISSIIIHHPFSYQGLEFTAHNQGLVRVSEELLTLRSRSFDTQSVARILSRQNASISVRFSPYGVRSSLNFITDSRNKLLPLFADILSQPLFQDNDINFAKNNLIQELEGQLKESDFKLARATQKLLFGETIWGVKGFLDKELISSLKREDLSVLQERWQHTSNVWFVALTSLSRDHIAKFVDQIIPSDLKYAPIPPPPTRITNNIWGQTINLEDSSLEQTKIVLLLRGLPIHHPKYRTLLVLSDLLTQNLLYPKIRGEYGLAYGINASSLTYPDRGFLQITTATTSEQTKLIIDLILEQLEILKSQEFDDKSLSIAKESIINSATLRLTSNSNIANLFYYLKLHNFPPDNLDKLRENYGEISSRDIIELANRLWEDIAPAILTIGPKTKP